MKSLTISEFHNLCKALPYYLSALPSSTRGEFISAVYCLEARYPDRIRVHVGKSSKSKNSALCSFEYEEGSFTVKLIVEFLPPPSETD